MQFWALIVDSFRESLDRKIFWVMVFISIMVAGALVCVGFSSDGVSVLFGAWEFETPLYNPASVVGRGNIAAIAVGCMDLIVGWIGLMLVLIATAGFFPSFMEKGPIDVLLAKPISRPMLFLGKYIGTMVFVLLQAIIFVVPTFLVMGLRWQTWLPGYLLAIPLLVLMFSYLYCISVWVGVATRSTLAAIFVCIGAWFFFFGIQSANNAFELYPKWKEHRVAYDTLRAIRWMMPKTEDISYLAERWAGADPSSEMFGEQPDAAGEELMRRAETLDRQRRKVDAFHSIGTSLLFETVVVLWAMWMFSRKDF